MSCQWSNEWEVVKIHGRGQMASAEGVRALDGQRSRLQEAVVKQRSSGQKEWSNDREGTQPLVRSGPQEALTRS